MTPEMLSHIAVYNKCYVLPEYNAYIADDYIYLKPLGTPETLHLPTYAIHLSTIKKICTLPRVKDRPLRKH